MNYSLLNFLGTILFACAILHSFLVKGFQYVAKKYPKGSIGENLFHLLGEMEVVFGIWAAVYIVLMAIISGPHSAVIYVQERDFTEPMFVFVIMSVCSTRPIIEFTNLFIVWLRSLFQVLELTPST